jgi:hypothetical protein
MNGGYGGEMAGFVSEKMAGLGGWFSEVAYHITHDPLWGGITIGVIVLILALTVASRRTR